MAADRIAERMLAAAPYRLDIARTATELEAVFRLRGTTVIEMGWAQPDDIPEGVERNADDHEAIHVTADDGNGLAGTARVVLPRAGRQLPLERDFRIAAKPDDVEIGRTIIVPRLRGATGHGLVIALFARCWQEMRSRGFSSLISAVPPRLVEVYRSLGFTVLELGAAREHWGEQRMPVRFDVLGSVPQLERTLGVPRRRE